MKIFLLLIILLFSFRSFAQCFNPEAGEALSEGKVLILELEEKEPEGDMMCSQGASPESMAEQPKSMFKNIMEHFCDPSHLRLEFGRQIFVDASDLTWYQDEGTILNGNRVQLEYGGDLYFTGALEFLKSRSGTVDGRPLNTHMRYEVGAAYTREIFKNFTLTGKFAIMGSNDQENWIARFKPGERDADFNIGWGTDFVGRYDFKRFIIIAGVGFEQYQEDSVIHIEGPGSHWKPHMGFQTRKLGVEAKITDKIRTGLLVKTVNGKFETGVNASINIDRPKKFKKTKKK